MTHLFNSLRPLLSRRLVVSALFLGAFAHAALLATPEKELRAGSPSVKDLLEYWSAGQLLLNGEDANDQERLYQIQLQAGYDEDDPIVMYNPPWLLVWIYPL